MIPAIRQKFLFGGMRKRQVTDVVTECCHSHDSSPICYLVRTGERFQQMLHIVRYIVRIRDYVENSARKFHYTKRMLEPLMSCTRINEIGHRQLVNMTQSLERP